MTTGCTHCGGGGGPLRTWLPQDGFESPHSRTLLPLTTGALVSPDGRSLALLACDVCPAHGFYPDLLPSLYVSRDGGLHWTETELPEGLWRTERIDDSGRVVLLRGEPAQADRFQGGARGFGSSPVSVDRLIYSNAYPGGDIIERFDTWPPPILSPILAPLTAADGSEWTVPERTADDPRQTVLLRNGAPVRDFSPYAVLDVALDVAGQRLAISLGCGLRDTLPCHPDLAHTAFLWIFHADGTELGGYHLDLADFRPILDPPATRHPDDPAPWLGELRWLGDGVLWASVNMVNPITFRPLAVDFPATLARSFAEEGPGFSRVMAVASGEALPQRDAMVALDRDNCLNLRPLPRVDDFHEPITCLPGATPLTLPGESATDAAGNDWLFVQSGELQGWVAAAFVELTD